MFCATSVIKPGPTRIGRLGKTVTLPRTVPVVTLFAAGGGALVGVAIMLVLSAALTSIVLAAVTGGAAGWFAVSYSPLKGESLAKWFGLKITASRGQLDINGERTRVHIGIAAVNNVARGRIRVVPGAVDVRPGTVDERGHFLSNTHRALAARMVPSDTQPPSGTPRRPSHDVNPHPGSRPDVAHRLKADVQHDAEALPDGQHRSADRSESPLDLRRKSFKGSQPLRGTVERDEMGGGR